jgi:hypothetical protein
VDGKLNNIEELHAAVTAGMTAKLAGVPTVDYYPKIGRRITLPAVLIEISEFEPGTDPGTGEAALIGRFQARAIVDPNDPKAMIKVRDLAARIVVAIQGENWGLPVGLAQFVQAGEDGMKPELDSYLVWLVEWTHEFHLGELVWPYPDESGLVVMLGIDPETGLGNESKYRPAGEDPQVS